MQSTSELYIKTSPSSRHYKFKMGKSTKRISKRTVTQIYAEQLAPLYSDFKMYQIKAALILTNNNMHESRLLLDMKNKIAAMKKQFLISTSGKGTHQSYDNTVQYQETSKVETETSSSLTKSFSFSSVTATSSVYDFSDTSEEREAVVKYTSLNKKGKQSAGSPNDCKKVGVLIVRDAKGYKVSPLK